MKTVTFPCFAHVYPFLPCSPSLFPQRHMQRILWNKGTERQMKKLVTRSAFWELALVVALFFCPLEGCVVSCLGWLRVEVCRAVRDKSGRHSVIIEAVRNCFFNVTSVVFPAYCTHFPFIVVWQYTLSSNQFCNPENALKSNLAVGV